MGKNLSIEGREVTEEPSHGISFGTGFYILSRSNIVFQHLVELVEAIHTRI
jgi:hypothetical protein